MLLGWFQKLGKCDGPHKVNRARHIAVADSMEGTKKLRE